MIYRPFRALARLTLGLFFREIEVEGREHVPAAGPVLLVPNHANSLVDPLVVLTALGRRVTLTAKNTLGKNPLLDLLMRGMGVVTFHRRSDVGKGADPRENVRTLQRCRQILAAGGAICIFPEGISHSDPGMRPFHTGPARIAVDYVGKDGDPGGLKIVPVGLLYTAKDRFRSSVWVRFGEPLAVADWLAEHPEGDARELTEELRRRVEALTVTYETRRESLILTWAADVVATRAEMPAPLGRPDRSAADWFRLLGRLREGYRALRDTHPGEVEQLTARIRRYRSELKRQGLEPGEVYLPMHPARALLFVVRELELLLVGAPMALFGAFGHLVPYLAVRRIARALSKDKDHWATNVVYPSLVLFPLWYLVVLGLSWWLLPAGWAALYSIALPYTGYYALLYGERAGSTLRRTRAFLRLLLDREGRQRLASEGRAIVTEVRALDRLLHPQPSPHS